MQNSDKEYEISEGGRGPLTYRLFPFRVQNFRGFRLIQITSGMKRSRCCTHSAYTNTLALTDRLLATRHQYTVTLALHLHGDTDRTGRRSTGRVVVAAAAAVSSNFFSSIIFSSLMAKKLLARLLNYIILFHLMHFTILRNWRTFVAWFA